MGVTGIDTFQADQVIDRGARGVLKVACVRADIQQIAACTVEVEGAASVGIVIEAAVATSLFRRASEGVDTEIVVVSGGERVISETNGAGIVARRTGFGSRRTNDVVVVNLETAAFRNEQLRLSGSRLRVQNTLLLIVIVHDGFALESGASFRWGTTTVNQIQTQTSNLTLRFTASILNPFQLTRHKDPNIERRK